MTYRYRLLLGGHRFFSADPGVISYILSHSDDFPKPSDLRRGLKAMLGDGVLAAEGADHKRQRRVLNPSFSGPAVRNMIPIFYDKAYDLKDMFLNMIDSEDETSPTPCRPEDKVTGAKKIDVLRYLGQCTLDVIGVAGFDYDFAAMKEPDNELAEAYRQMMMAGQTISVLAVLQSFVPFLNKIVSVVCMGTFGDAKQPTKRSKIIRASQEVTGRIGRVCCGY